MKSSRPGRFGWRATMHALPGRQRRVEVGAHRLERRCSASISRSRASVRGSSLERVDLLQEHGDRLLEVERFGHGSSCRARLPQRHRRPGPTTCSTSAISVGDGRTRICDDTSARDAQPARPASSISNETRRSPRWREKISPSASNRPRSAGSLHADGHLAREPLAHAVERHDLRRQHPHRSRRRVRACRGRAPACRVSIRRRASLIRLRETRSPRRRPARPRA